MNIQRLVLMVCLTTAIPSFLAAQRYFSRNANVHFDATSKNSPEQVEAKTASGTVVIDLPTSRVEASVLVKSFQFEKALMQEHFNENYMESTKFPKAVFKGKLDNAAAVQFEKDGSYTAQLSGDLTIHGITKAVKVPASIVVKGGKISTATNFEVSLKDYGIEIPSLVADKLGTTAKVSFSGDLESMKQ